MRRCFAILAVFWVFGCGAPAPAPNAGTQTPAETPTTSPFVGHWAAEGPERLEISQEGEQFFVRKIDQRHGRWQVVYETVTTIQDGALPLMLNISISYLASADAVFLEGRRYNRQTTPDYALGEPTP